jgi:Fe-S oxidoreductase
MALEEEGGHLVNIAKLLSVAEHAHYPFKSYPRKACHTILFPGCAFPSQFPRTMDALSQRCRDAGIGVAYDCCGSPLAGFGKAKSAQRVLDNLNRRFKQLGCERIVLVCPNCHAFLKGQLVCELIDIFDLLEELEVENVGEFGNGRLFVPCPDRKEHATEEKLRALCDLSGVVTLDHAPCCGLRPDLASKGADYSARLGRKAFEQAGGERIYTYCASCAGQFSRLGFADCRHIVSIQLGIDEQPDSSRALANRARRKFDRNTSPIESG